MKNPEWFTEMIFEFDIENIRESHTLYNEYDLTKKQWDNLRRHTVSLICAELQKHNKKILSPSSLLCELSRELTDQDWDQSIELISKSILSYIKRNRKNVSR